MVKKYVTSMLLGIVIVIMIPLTALAEDIRVAIDGFYVRFDSQPVIINGRVMVPMRTIFEELGYQIIWDEGRQIITAKGKENTIFMQIGNQSAYINDAKIVLDSPPIIMDSRTLVPVRFISEGSGAVVEWDTISKTVFITTTGQTGPVASQALNIEELKQSVVMIQSDLMQGSGFVVGNGIIATNFHVIDKASRLKFYFQNGDTYEGDVAVIGFDYNMDMAILKINKEDMIPLPLGNSSSIKKGDPVYAIGSPLSNFNFATSGNIVDFNSSVICMSAEIKHGSSGGALFNEKGEVIGIPFSFDSSGQYYSLPIDLLKGVVLDKSYSLEDMKSLTYPLEPPKLFDLYDIEDGTNIAWEPIYNVDGFIVYMSDTMDGNYEETLNPITRTQIWRWGFPYSLAVSSSYEFHKYIKIATVRDGQISPLSKTIEINIGITEDAYNKYQYQY